MIAKIDECYRLGCNCYITKPLDFKKFTETLTRLVSSCRLFNSQKTKKRPPMFKTNESKSILIVEDDEIIAELIKEIIIEQGYVPYYKKKRSTKLLAGSRKPP
jgi:response regulator of citrate/malate metabolism